MRSAPSDVDAGRGHQPGWLRQHGGAWKQRRGVTVGAQPEQDQIEAGNRGVARKRALQLGFVETGRKRGIALLGANAVHTVGPNRDVGQHRLERHAGVAVGMVRRHVPFVAPEELAMLPGHAGSPSLVRRQQRVEAARRRAAGERHHETSARIDRVDRPAHEHVGGRAVHRVRRRRRWSVPARGWSALAP